MVLVNLFSIERQKDKTLRDFFIATEAVTSNYLVLAAVEVRSEISFIVSLFFSPEFKFVTDSSLKEQTLN